MPSLAEALALILEYKYAIMFPLAIVEGPILSVLAGFLLYQGYVSFVPTYFTLMMGDLVGDTIWYSIGRHGARRFINRYGHTFGFTPPRVAAVEALFKKHQTKTILISKLTTGFGLAPLVLMTAGSVGTPFSTFILLNTLGQFLWSGFLLIIGYYFGASYELIDAQLKTAYMVAGGVTVIIGLYCTQRYLRGRVTKKEL